LLAQPNLLVVVTRRILVENLLRDLRFATRVLLRSRSFTLVAVLTLAVGIGANSAIFSVVKSVLLSPLPYPQSENLLRIWESRPSFGIPQLPVSPANFRDWREQNQVFEQLAGFSDRSLNLTEGERSEGLSARLVTADLFELLRSAPALGRTFEEGEDQPGAEDVVVLSDGLWRRRFGADLDILDRTLSLHGIQYRVIGVMPPGFEFGEGVELWAPLEFREEDLDRGAFFLEVIARLKPGVSMPEAGADMLVVIERLAAEFPETNAGSALRLVPLREHVVGDVRATLLVLFGAVGFVLLMACVNVANLLLSRTVGRQREIALRGAIGASRGRILRQIFTENLLLASIGSLSGMFLAFVALDWMKRANLRWLPRLEEIQLDLPVFVFTLLVTLLVALLSGLLPAIKAYRLDLVNTLKEGGAMATSQGLERHVRRAMIVLQIALAMVLLIGAGLTVRSFQRLLNVDPGFAVDGTLVSTVALAETTYAEEHQQNAFYRLLLDEVRSLPGMTKAALTTSAPFSRRGFKEGFIIVGKPVPNDQPNLGLLDGVSTGYFETMGIDLVQGRFLDDRDRLGGQNVVVIDETLASLWPQGESPLGQRIVLLDQGERTHEVIGVVRAVRRSGLESEPESHMYIPLEVFPQPTVDLVMESPLKLTGLVGLLRSSFLAVDPNQPLGSLETFADAVARSTLERRFNMQLMGVFAVLALFLAVVGIYGILTYSVALRTREIGIRSALGASRRSLLRLVLGDAMKLTVMGVGVGVLAALGLTRLMQSLLYNLSANDPLTFAGLSLFFVGVAGVASLIPAIRASRIAPTVALREE
jgi:putative ABC transport system permease protein